ncbi:MAG TPA: exosortase/archaeosortase family protein [Chthoniobacterales bacterium]|nr:exosortase/archaeosortase family protein [Chthoniobacterales bacterium]
MNSAIEPTTKPSRLPIIVAGLAMFALWFILCRHLSDEWSVNEQYSYGWFVPFFALLLFWLRWEDRPAAHAARVQAPSSKLQSRTGIGVVIAAAILALLVLAPVRLFEVANPDWRPLGWVHAAAVAAITLIVIWWIGGMPWVRHFGFPVAFFFVAVPWISPIEQPIVQGLMRVAAAVATEAITLCGIPAQLEGNLIRVSTGLVGVSEACSGVRSLQTSLMIGLLFGELKRLSVPRRFFLVLGAVVIAILANFGRAFFLVWVAATDSVAAVERWHDIAGYTIVAVVFLGSLLLTKALDRDKVGSRNSEVGNGNGEATIGIEAASQRFLLPKSYFLICLLWVLAVEIGVESWYRSHEKDLTVIGGWTVRPPEKAPGFRELKIEDQVRQTLRFDEGREVVWKSSLNPAGAPPSPSSALTNYLFFFRWNPGSASVLRARAHRPDICLPSAGWTMVADRGAKVYRGPGDIEIAARHVIFKQTHGNAVAHTFFCLQEDKIRRGETRPDAELAAGVQPEWSMAARVRVVRNGIRNLGQQVLEVVVMGAGVMGDEEAEGRFGQLVRDVVVEK